MDLREVLGMGMKLGVKVSDNTKAFFKKTKADVVLLSLSTGLDIARDTAFRLRGRFQGPPFSASFFFSGPAG
jgi:hypothetical protein